MKVGIVAGSMKPVHKAHWALIEMASKECDSVSLLVSTSDRKRKGEHPISGQQMKKIWESYLIPHLPSNVKLELGVQPIKRVYEILGEANDTDSIDEFVIYSDPIDVASRFPLKNQLKYFGDLYDHGQVNFKLIDRVGELDVSGTQMRALLKKGMKEAFVSLLPEGIDGHGVWTILSGEVSLREFVKES